MGCPVGSYFGSCFGNRLKGQKEGGRRRDRLVGRMCYCREGCEGGTGTSAAASGSEAGRTLLVPAGYGDRVGGRASPGSGTILHLVSCLRTFCSSRW